MNPKTTIYAPQEIIRLVRTTSVEPLVTREGFMDLLETCQRYVEELRPLREDQKGLNEAINIIMEMKFVACFNYHFRKENFKALEELLDDMYIELNGE